MAPAVAIEVSNMSTPMSTKLWYESPFPRVSRSVAEKPNMLRMRITTANTTQIMPSQ